MAKIPALSLPESALPEHVNAVREANRAFSQRYPGETTVRQPVHSVYGGGHLFRADTARKLGNIALRALDDYAPEAATFARAIGLDSASPNDAELVYTRVREKLASEPVEDFRIDFEDGYGARADDEEDHHVQAAAREVALGARNKALPAGIGIRLKPLNEEWRQRSVRTLDLFLTTLAHELSGSLPTGLMLTVPKVTLVEQVQYMVALLGAFEQRLGFPERTLRFEIMVEMPQVIIDATGRCLLPALIDAGAGRITGAHFGTYDYTAGCGITAAYQKMQHEACQFALRTMQVALAGTGVWMSDGSTTVLPVPPFPNEKRQENTAAMHRAWRMHYEDVRHSLANGFYQGWDLHPAQLPTRYAAVFSFFLEGIDAAGERLRNFVAKAAQATLVGSDFDDAATGQGLLNYFLRAVECGAISADEAAARSGLTLEELQEKSFVRILRTRATGQAST
jgi:citrate lyase beta subunit